MVTLRLFLKRRSSIKEGSLTIFYGAPHAAELNLFAMILDKNVVRFETKPALLRAHAVEVASPCIGAKEHDEKDFQHSVIDCL